MALGISESIGLAATLVFALPLGILGGQFLLEGRLYLGGLLVLFAVLMVIVPRYVLTPDDLLGEAASKTVGKVVKTPDEEE